MVLDYRPVMKGLLEIIGELAEEYGSVNEAARGIGMPQATLHALNKGETPDLKRLEIIAQHRCARHRWGTRWRLLKDIDSRGMSALNVTR